MSILCGGLTCIICYGCSKYTSKSEQSFWQQFTLFFETSL